ncbi:MAG TPA: twin-arginine translocase TatA/TatE family subunit [candidate division Zixibacteria bacterium]|nr:twin-arginine translocase TatA/TatE family subunit [candidate division Zixibacteria bacterium]
MSTGELIFLFVLALVVFGPKRLPDIARQVGKILAEFKRASNEFQHQLQAEITESEKKQEPKPAVVNPPVPPEERPSILDLPKEPTELTDAQREAMRLAYHAQHMGVEAPPAGSTVASNVLTGAGQAVPPTEPQSEESPQPSGETTGER